MARDWKGPGYPGQLGTALLPVMPTPTASDRFGAGHQGGGGANLRTAVDLLPTPTANHGDGSGRTMSAETAARRRGEGRRMLDDAIALLPTPWASEGAKGGPNQRGSSGDLTLTSSVMLLPTPTATDANASRNATANRSHIPATTNAAGWTLHDVAYADRWAQYGPAIARWEAITGRPAPEPTVTGRRGGRRLSARFVEWMLGWPEGWVTDILPNTASLKCIGNGVCPQQGAEAYRRLLGVR